METERKSVILHPDVSPPPRSIISCRKRIIGVQPIDLFHTQHSREPAPAPARRSPASPQAPAVPFSSGPSLSIQVTHLACGVAKCFLVTHMPRLCAPWSCSGRGTVNGVEPPYKNRIIMAFASSGCCED